MQVKTNNDGEWYTVTVEDSSKHFSFEIDIVNRDGLLYIDYTNSDNIKYNLLKIENDQVTSEVPQVEEY